MTELLASVGRPAPEDARRTLAITADGRHVALLAEDELHLDGRAVLRARGLVAVAAVDGAMWAVGVRDGVHELHRLDLDGTPIAAAQTLGALGENIRITASRRGARRALIEGTSAVLVHEERGELSIETLASAGTDRRIFCDGRGIAERRGVTIALRADTGFVLPADLRNAVLVGGATVFDGAALLVVLQQGDRRTVLVGDLRARTLRSRIRIGEANVVAIAERRGLIALGRGAHIALLDLRVGHCIGERILPATLDAATMDPDGARLIVVDVDGRALELGSSLRDVSSERANDQEEIAEGEAPSEPVEGESVEEKATEPAEAPSSPPVTEANAASVTDVPLLALRSPASGLQLSPEELETYLGDVRALIVAYAVTASGRKDVTVEAGARERFRTWHRPGAPHKELAAELGLSSMATSILWLAAAPLVWGELARAYAEIKGDPGRPLVDEYLIAQLLEADPATRAQLARELDDDSPLRRHGVIDVGPGARPFAALTVHPAVIRRLAGERFETGARAPTIALDAIRAPSDEIARATAALARSWPGPVRVVIRGQLGSGRRTIAAAFSALAGRHLGLVELSAPSPGQTREQELRRSLRDVSLRGWIPCVTIEHFSEDPHEHERLRAVIDAHPGPLFVRASAGTVVPVGPEHHVIALSGLDETSRRDAWRDCLAAHGLSTAAAEGLAARYAIGPGVMNRAAARTRSDDPAGTEKAVAAALRQYRGGLIGDVATRVERLPAWNDLVLPVELSASLRALIGRVRRRRTVLETWGMGQVASTARGVTALFQGGPGTGKTMAAGVVARELGWELWRVDLSRVMSRWLGETEKNLARVFDAAEGGEIVLLFDEADSLFGKRTEVKSSNDRYANLAVNYLLQRLDDFNGVAILTTNFGTTIDSAVRRRLAGELQFPFPDETERERLWRAHLPASVPGATELDLSEVARRYQLAGGYIRNAALRACFLAADQDCRLTIDHVMAAVESEYHDRARVSVGGRLE